MLNTNLQASRVIVGLCLRFKVQYVSLYQLEAIQRWSAICRVWPWTLTYQKFLLCISSQDQDLYSHQKLNMCISWFSSHSGYRRRRRRQRRRRRRRQQRRTEQYND